MIELPSNLEAERSVLGAAMLDRRVLDDVEDIVRPADFFHAGHRATYTAMLGMGDEAVIDPVTLGAKLELSNELRLIGGLEGLGKLTDINFRTSHGRHHATIVANMARVRRMVLLCRTLAEQGCEPQADPLAWIAGAEEQLLKASRATAAKGYEPVSEHIHTVVSTMCDEGAVAQAARVAGRPIPSRGVPFGFERLEYMTGGAQPANLIILAARPSMGKTAMAMNISVTAARAGHPVLWLSMEMSTKELLRRLACTEARVNGLELAAGEGSSGDYARLLEASNEIQAMPIAIDDRSAQSITGLRSAGRRWRKDRRFFPPLSEDEPERLGLIVVDYIQLGKGEEGSRTADTRHLEVGEISGGLKAMSKELGVPVLALSQLNRGVESRDNKRPRLSDLRDSGKIEEDADVVAFLYRDIRYNSKADPGAAELDLAKQRNGPTGKVDLLWTPEHTLFQDVKGGPRTVGFYEKSI